MKLRTPKDALNLVMMTVLIYLSAPFFVAWYFAEALSAGDFPPESDAIAIPIMGFVCLCLLALPFIVTFIIVVVRDYPGAVSILSFNDKRPIWNFCWSLFFGLLALFCIAEAVDYLTVFRWSNLCAGLHAILTAYLLLCFGASISYSKIFQRRKFL